MLYPERVDANRNGISVRAMVDKVSSLLVTVVEGIVSRLKNPVLKESGYSPP